MIPATSPDRSARPARPAIQDPYAPIIADFRAAMTQLKCASSRRLVRAGISMTQLHILFTLERHEHMTMSQLADVLDVSLSNATGLVDRIEERGYVERIRVPEDRRIVRIRVTEAGRRMLGEVDALSDDLLRSVLARVHRTKLSGVGEAVAALRGALEAVNDLATDRHPDSIAAPRSGPRMRATERTDATPAPRKDR